MKVYIAAYIFHEVEIYRVYSNEEEAQKHADALNKRHGDNYNKYGVLECEVHDEYDGVEYNPDDCV